METATTAKFEHLEPGMVISAGPTGLKAFAFDAEILEFLQQCYATAVKNTLYVALAASVVAVPFALGMQWLNVKNVSQENSTDTHDSGENDCEARQSEIR
jgi:hypothetical protein